MNKEQFLEGMNRAIVVLNITDSKHFVDSFHNVVAFALGRIDVTTPLEFDTGIGEYLSDFFVEDMTLDELYNQLTEENNAE